jgi:23S rRNA (guanosine2251-2'-O)-methyltransferase
MNLIIGRKPVLEAIKSGETIDHIYILQGQKGSSIFEIYKLAKQHGIRANEVPPAKFKSFSLDPNTQGVVAIKSTQKYYEFEEVIVKAKKDKYPLILILDSIQDPHNLGAILRSAECAGVGGVIITKHNSASVTETVVKTSAGASEHVMICQVNNLNQAMKQLKDVGFWLVGSSTEGDSKPYTEVDYKIPVALVVGNEEKGIRRLTAGECDILVKIPMQGKIESLNVSVATGILLFEIVKKRA